MWRAADDHDGAHDPLVVGAVELVDPLQEEEELVAEVVLVA